MGRRVIIHNYMPARRKTRDARNWEVVTTLNVSTAQARSFNGVFVRSTGARKVWGFADEGDMSRFMDAVRGEVRYDAAAKFAQMDALDALRTALREKETRDSTRDTAIVEGREVKIGDRVGFKSDVEQHGRIIAIRGTGSRATLVLENPNGFSGGYIGGKKQTEERADDCWVD